MEREVILSIQDLSYSYLSNFAVKRFDALKGISLDVYAGESFGFLGHNGAGKTTAIKCILSLVRPTRGQVRLFGQPSSDVAQRRNVGYLPEQPYFYDYLTVREIMEMYADLYGLERSVAPKAIDTALDLVKISAKSKSAMRGLSKGLMQRVALAQAIVAGPKLLVLDEPFSGLDPIGRREFRDIFFALKQKGTTIFMSSHILSDVEFLCDRVSIMAHGQLKGVFDLKALGAATAGIFELVLRNYERAQDHVTVSAQSVQHGSDARNKFLKIEFSERGAADRALSAAVQHGAEVESFNFVQGSLEDLFVKLVKFDEAGR